MGVTKEDIEVLHRVLRGNGELYDAVLTDPRDNILWEKYGHDWPELAYLEREKPFVVSDEVARTYSVQVEEVAAFSTAQEAAVFIALTYGGTQ